MLKIGDIISVAYATGEDFEGTVEKIRTIEGKGILILVNDFKVGYRSLYANKCDHISYASPVGGG